MLSNSADEWNQSKTLLLPLVQISKGDGEDRLRCFCDFMLCFSILKSSGTSWCACICLSAAHLPSGMLEKTKLKHRQ